ncbi:hypothetical protein CN234_36520, partial [Sinorhizobium meliloti]
STHRDLQVSGELQESICRNKTTAYLLNAIPLPLGGEMAGRPEGVESQQALDHDIFRSGRPENMNVIDSKKLRPGMRAENRTHFSSSRSSAGV